MNVGVEIQTVASELHRAQDFRLNGFIVRQVQIYKVWPEFLPTRLMFTMLRDRQLVWSLPDFDEM